jgi:hypothetical protein
MIRVLLLTLAIVLAVGPTAYAKPPSSKARVKFYDFSDQLIEGEIKKPTSLYVDARKKVRFERLLKLKKSFLPDLFKTAKDRVFK